VLQPPVFLFQVLQPCFAFQQYNVCSLICIHHHQTAVRKVYALLSRYRNRVIAQLRPFHADLIHITGPGDMGVLGFWVAHCLGIPLVASWHTNLHEYAGRRLEKLLSFLPQRWWQPMSRTAERESLRTCVSFYRLARFLFAPNETMVGVLQQRTRKLAFLMSHGVDTDVYSPRRRNRQTRSFCIGYVGRLTPEKNVRLLAALE
jgi:phosphatidylinositol alpha 1,6-mannosyltransferase